MPAELPGEAVRFDSSSGTVLHGWLLSGNPGAGVVVLMHGVRGNRLSMLERARFLVGSGYSVLLFDFQAHGESLGKQITFGYLESRDAQAAVAFARERYPAARIGVLGVSLGGAAALLADPPLDVDALVLEMTYGTIDRAISNRLQIRLGSIGARLTPLLTWQLRPRLGISREALRPLHRIAEVSVPVLIVAGAQDQHTTLPESLEMFAVAREPKALWVVESAAHVDLHARYPEEYEERIREYFQQWL